VEIYIDPLEKCKKKVPRKFIIPLKALPFYEMSSLEYPNDLEPFIYKPHLKLLDQVKAL
jgi:hypothetical protein